MEKHWLNETFFEFDDAIFRAVYQMEETIPFLRGFARFISYFGDCLGMFFLVSTLLLFIFKKTRKIGIIVGVAIVFDAILINFVLKDVIARPRQFWNELSPYYHMWVEAKGTWHDSYSFPSGHTGIATAFGVGLFLSCNKKYSWSFLFIPLLMAWSRVALFVHYPTDVIAAIILISLSTVGAYFLAEKVIFKFGFVQKIIDFDIFAKKES